MLIPDDDFHLRTSVERTVWPARPRRWRFMEAGRATNEILIDGLPTANIETSECEQFLPNMGARER